MEISGHNIAWIYLVIPGNFHESIIAAESETTLPPGNFQAYLEISRQSWSLDLVIYKFQKFLFFTSLNKFSLAWGLRTSVFWHQIDVKILWKGGQNSTCSPKSWKFAVKILYFRHETESFQDFPDSRIFCSPENPENRINLQRGHFLGQTCKRSTFEFCFRIF